MKYTKKTVWTTHLGNEVSIEGMHDMHLANAIQFLTRYGNNMTFLKALKKEAKLRKLSQEFLDGAQYPYKDGKGNWIVWDFFRDGPRAIGSYIRV